MPARWSSCSDPDGEFYFLEMNTRLQVEHPVTELVTGTDLVRAQIRVAEGQPLPWTQEDLRPRGHAIECRVYAEDPADGFMPSLGEILLMHEPAGPGVRIDSGIRQGDEVTMYYDPMIAKLSLHGEDRAAAIDRAVAALKDYAVLGVTTNVEYLMAILQDQAFAAGRPAHGVPGRAPARLERRRSDDGGPGPGGGGGGRVRTRGTVAGPGSGSPAGGRADGPWQLPGPFRLRGWIENSDPTGKDRVLLLNFRCDDGTDRPWTCPARARTGAW